MSTILDFNRDVAGSTAYAPLFPTDIYSATLVNGAAATITVPNNHSTWIVSFSYQPGTNVWVSVTGTAAIPVGGTFATAISELNPSQRTVYAYHPDGTTRTVLSLITDNATADVEVAFYAVSQP